MVGLRDDPDMAPWWERLGQAPQRLRRWSLLRDPLARPVDDLHRGHIHPIPTLVLPLHGVVRVRGRSGAIDLLPDQALVIAPCTRHRHEPLRHGSAYFHLGFKGPCCDVAVHVAERRVEAHLPAPALRARLDRLLGEPGQDAGLAILREVLTRVRGARLREFAPRHPAVDRMTHWLWWHYDRPIDTEQVLAASGLRRSRAYQLFSAAHGHGPAEECERLRLETARYLLEQGLAIAAVAERCGFPDRRAFTRSFKRRYGVAPSRLDDART